MLSVNMLTSNFFSLPIWLSNRRELPENEHAKLLRYCVIKKNSDFVTLKSAKNNWNKLKVKYFRCFYEHLFINAQKRFAEAYRIVKQRGSKLTDLRPNHALYRPCCIIVVSFGAMVLVWPQNIVLTPSLIFHGCASGSLWKIRSNLNVGDSHFCHQICLNGGI